MIQCWVVGEKLRLPGGAIGKMAGLVQISGKVMAVVSPVFDDPDAAILPDLGFPVLSMYPVESVEAINVDLGVAKKNDFPAVIRRSHA